MSDRPGPIRLVPRLHHPIMRSETGPFSGCRCGEVKLGEDVLEHVAAKIREKL